MKTTKLLAAILTITTGFFTTVHSQSWLTNGLVGFYPFSGNANDASGNGNNAVSHGAQLATNRFGIAGDSYSFASTYIETTNSVGFPISTSDFTLSVWVNFSTILPFPNVAMLFVNRSLNQFQLAFNSTTGKNGFLDFVTGGSLACHSTTNAWTENKWYNVMVVRTNNAFTIYRDGSVIGQAQTLLGNNAPAASRLLDFGKRSTDGAGPLYGQLDDIRIYNRALSTNEVAQLYAIESGPILNVRKAVYLDSSNLWVGTNYQVQVFTDLNTWTNFGAVFTATTNYWRSTNYWDVSDWNQLFFRLKVSP